MLIHSVPWLATKPENRVDLDPSHPLRSRLKFAFVPVGGELFPRDLVSGIVPTNQASGHRDVVVDRYGRGLRPPTSGGAALSYGRTGMDDLTGTTGLTIVARARLYTNATFKYLFYSGENAAGDGFGLALDDQQLATNGFFFDANNGHRTSTVFNVLGTNSENFYHNIAGTFQTDGTAASFFVDGAPVGDNSTIMSVTGDANRVTKVFAYRSGALNTVGIIYLYVFEGVLSDAAIRSISLSPYQMLQPQRSIIPISVAVAPGGLSIPIAAYHYNHHLGSMN